MSETPNKDEAPKKDMKDVLAAVEKVKCSCAESTDICRGVPLGADVRKVSSLHARQLRGPREDKEALLG